MKEFIRWAIALTLIVAGVSAFIILLADNEPITPDFIIVKLAALALMAACVIAGKKLNQLGLLPEIEEE